MYFILPTSSDCTLPSIASSMVSLDIFVSRDSLSSILRALSDSAFCSGMEEIALPMISRSRRRLFVCFKNSFIDRFCEFLAGFFAKSLSNLSPGPASQLLGEPYILMLGTKCIKSWNFCSFQFAEFGVRFFRVSRSARITSCIRST